MKNLQIDCFEVIFLLQIKYFSSRSPSYSDEFICDVTGQRGSNIIKDVGGARLVEGSFGFDAVKVGRVLIMFNAAISRQCERSVRSAKLLVMQ